MLKLDAVSVRVQHFNAFIITQTHLRHELLRESHLQKAIDTFANTQVNITTAGRSNLGVPLGSDDYVNRFVSSQVEKWVEQTRLLSEIAATQPHAALAGLTHGLSEKWTFLSSTNPNIRQILFSCTRLFPHHSFML